MASVCWKAIIAIVHASMAKETLFLAGTECGLEIKKNSKH